MYVDIIRKCISCGCYKNRDEMIKITKEYVNGNIVVEPSSKIFGRSAYLCYNRNCIETALKKSKINKVLHTNEDVKGILDEQFKS